VPLSMTSLQEVPAYVFLQLVTNADTRITFSQLGEDIIINHLLRYHTAPVTRGFYVDIGAYHPRKNSNTHFLTLLGWTGVNVEPSKEHVEAFRELRPNDVTLHLGVGTTDGELTYYKFQNSDVNTFSAEAAKKWESYGWQQVGTETVLVKPINEVLAASVPPGQVIDVMNLDVQGFDREVIRGLDLGRFRPKILVIELHGLELLQLAEDETIAYLISQGFRVVSVVLSSVILIDQRVAKHLD